LVRTLLKIELKIRRSLQKTGIYAVCLFMKLSVKMNLEVDIAEDELHSCINEIFKNNHNLPNSKKIIKKYNIYLEYYIILWKL